MDRDDDEVRIQIDKAYIGTIVTNLHDGKWHLIGADYDDAADTATMYIDGVGVLTNTSFNVGVVTNDSKWKVGGGSYDYEGGFIGPCFVANGATLGAAGWSNLYHNGGYPTNGSVELLWGMTNTANSWPASTRATNLCPSFGMKLTSLNEPLWTNGCLLFDGANDFIHITNYEWNQPGDARMDLIQEKTNHVWVSFWFNSPNMDQETKNWNIIFQATGGYPLTIRTGGYGGDGSGILGVFTENGSKSAQTNNVITADDTWYHINV
jgi:hypothetical protein